MTTKQEYFDKTIATLKTMKERSIAVKDGVDGVASCVYEGPNGYHCAVGMHLPPGPWMACGGDVMDLFMEFPKVIDMLAIEDEDECGMEIFWSQLQQIHDEPRNWDASGFKGWPDVRDFCRHFELSLPEGLSW